MVATNFSLVTLGGIVVVVVAVAIGLGIFFLRK